jgi:hypothetical protein
MDCTINTKTDISFIPAENNNAAKENSAKVITNNSNFHIENTEKTITNMENISLSQEEYKIILHFKNGGLLKQLTCEQLKMLSKMYTFTEQDIIDLKDRPEIIEDLCENNFLNFKTLPEEIKQIPCIALKAFAANVYSCIEYIPKELQTQEICNISFEHRCKNFIYFDDKYKDFAMCRKYLNSCDKINFALIPSNFRQNLQQTLINIIKDNPNIQVSGIELLPKNILKENLDIICTKCVFNNEFLQNFDAVSTKNLFKETAKYSIRLVPKEFLTLELILLAIKHNSDRIFLHENPLNITDEYFIEHKEAIQQAVWERLNKNNKLKASGLLRYIPDYLSATQCLSFLQDDRYNYQYLPEQIKSDDQIISYLFNNWLSSVSVCPYEEEMLLQARQNSEKYNGILPDYFFNSCSHLANTTLVRKKNTFLKNIPNEIKTVDQWIYLCINVNRSYIKQMPESMITENILTELIDEYVQDDSRFDIKFTEFLYSHKLFNANMQQKIYVHTLKCSARCSRVFIKLLKSPNIPQNLKDKIFKDITQGNIGYPQPDITELYARTNPLQNQIPANFAARFLSSLYKFNGYNKLISSSLITELKEHQLKKTIKTLPLDTTKNIFTNAKVTGGRTIQVDTNENEAMFYKFRKPYEPLDDFIKEGHFLQFLDTNNAGKQLKNNLKSNIPILRKMVRIPINILPQCVHTCEDTLDIFFDEDDIECVDVLVFVGSIDYLQYAHKLDIQNPDNPFIKPEKGLLAAAHDLGIFVSNGILHNTTIPFFHYETDYRSWSVLNMILRGLPVTTTRGTADGYFTLNQNVFSMTGKLENWDSTATERPDYGYSGLRDLADYELYGEIETVANRRDSESHLFESIQQNIYTANIICECLIAIILLHARLHKKSADYHYKNENYCNHISKFIENIFTEFLTGILQDNSVNLQSFMQLEDKDYQHWLTRTTTELLYWTADQPITQDETDIQDCFSVHVNSKQLPSELFDDTRVSDRITYPKSFTQKTRTGKIHNHLGIYNGTFPLLALTNFTILFNTRINEYLYTEDK